MCQRKRTFKDGNFSVSLGIFIVDVCHIHIFFVVVRIHCRRTPPAKVMGDLSQHVKTIAILCVHIIHI